MLIQLTAQRSNTLIRAVPPRPTVLLHGTLPMRGTAKKTIHIGGTVTHMNNNVTQFPFDPKRRLTFRIGGREHVLIIPPIPLVRRPNRLWRKLAVFAFCVAGWVKPARQRREFFGA
jgi:hypothetical protein